MTDEKRFPPPISDHAARPLDVVRSAFCWLVTGPDPVAVNGAVFEGLPDCAVPLDELRDRLMHRRCPQPLRDAVWAHLIEKSRSQSRAGHGTWTLAAVGVGLPALIGVAARLSARFADDPSDIHAAVLAGFVAELAVVEIDRPRILLRLRWAAYRSGMACVRDALDAPPPMVLGGEFASAAPPAPPGHPDFVLARAVGEGAITAAEAELIAVTRLELTPLIEAAAARGMSYEAGKRARLRAEARLAEFLRDEAHDAELGSSTATASAPHLTRRAVPDVAVQAMANLVLTAAAARTASTPAALDQGADRAAPDRAVSERAAGADPSPSVTDAGEIALRRSARRVSLLPPISGVKGHGSSRPSSDTAAAGSTTEVPRCA